MVLLFNVVMLYGGKNLNGKKHLPGGNSKCQCASTLEPYCCNATSAPVIRDAAEVATVGAYVSRVQARECIGATAWRLVICGGLTGASPLSPRVTIASSGGPWS